MVGITCAIWLMSAAQSEPPDLLEILRQVDETTKSVREVRYDVKFWSHRGGGALPTPATVCVRRTLNPDFPMLRIESGVEDPDAEMRTTLVSDGGQITHIDWKQHSAVRGPREFWAERLRQYQRAFFMHEFVHATPFADEINAPERQYEGLQTIGGVECHVIRVTYAPGQQARWYFGVQTHLPHRVDRISGGYTLELSNIETQPSFDENTFSPRVPRDFETRELTRSGGPGMRREPELLVVGSLAPDWELSAPDGAVLRLEELRGSVVLLDFWNTWSSRSLEWMPRVEGFHKQYGAQKLLAIGVNASEDDGADPAAFMRSHGFTYRILLGGDEVAKRYRVAGFPTFFVIDAQGKVVYAGAGRGREKQVEDAIRTAIKRLKKPAD